MAVLHGENDAAREDMALASLFGGLALANAGLGAVHGFAAVIGGQFSAPHGAVCAALLPHVMAVNIRALQERGGLNYAVVRYQRVAAMLTGNQNATPEEGAEWVRQLVAELPIPRLAKYGIEEKHFTDLEAKAAKASSMKANPIELTAAELSEILQRAL